MRVLVVPIDAQRNTDRMLASVPDRQILRLDPDTATAFMRRISGGAVGLPMTVVTNRTGAVCAVRQRPLTPQDVPALLTRCRG